MDRDIDKKMTRTQKRALASGNVSVAAALVYGFALGAVGFGVLGLFTNLKTSLVALAGFVVYVAAYGFFKRRTALATVIGSIAGAAPPVVGYLAVANSFDAAALSLFLILVFWQMPHFYSIAIYRLKDYKAAGLPVLPVKKSIQATKLQIVFYICGFIIVTLMLPIFGYAGYAYFAVATALGIYWLKLAFTGWNKPDSQIWARRMFKASLIIITVLSGVISLNAWLP